MARCAGFKGDGTPCERIVAASATYCYSHDKARAEERSRNASKAAKSKGPSTDIVEVKAQLRTIADDVLEGRLDKGRGSVAAQILGVFVRVVEVERKVKEQDELVERLEQLEQAQHQRGGYGWAR
jgi:hypothetical protein